MRHVAYVHARDDRLDLLPAAAAATDAGDEGGAGTSYLPADPPPRSTAVRRPRWPPRGGG